MKSPAVGLMSTFVLLSVVTMTPAHAEDIADLRALVRQAEDGPPRAQSILGMAHFYGSNGGRDFAEAHHWFHLAAEEEDPLALFYLGAMHEDGIFVERDTARARWFYARSVPGLRGLAGAGDTEAMANLGLLYNLGVGIRAAPDSARYWVEKAAEAGNARAQYYAGFYHFHGVGGEKNPARAAAWLERAARSGRTRAQALLGNMLYRGWGVRKDLERAKASFEAAEVHPAGTEAIRDAVYCYEGIPHPGDRVIRGLLPPRSRLLIEEGDCGEACLWTLLRARGIKTTEIDINEDAGAPGRGLHAYELHRVLEKYDVRYRDTMGRPPIAYAPLLIKSLFSRRSPSTQEATYRSFLYDEVIASVERGTPVILGVKVYPGGHALHPLDHFILVVGHNEETDEIIYNSHNERARMKVEKLLDQSDGYSLINRYDLTSAIFVPLPDGGHRSR